MKSEKQFSQDKSALRKELKNARKLLKNKLELSNEICKAFLETKDYKECSTLLCYVSFGDEVNTLNILSHALEQNKIVAVPVCIDKSGNMDFYIIKSIDDLHIGSFGILEPRINECEKLNDIKNAVIVVPALCFDAFGNRLGYGKGYYDRFLQKHSLISFGLCYNSLIQKNVPVDKYDQKVDYVITEKQIINCNGGQNG